ncbi:MAG: tail fiber domain-containing protein [Bacteroidales bacterium]|jgi:hypothetical protein|nr:tail fiber domain-containing protein [Bacteroidales bacterium]
MKTLATVIKVTLLLCMIVLVNDPLSAQSPEKMSYQAVVRNPEGVLVSNKTVGMRVTILREGPAGTVVYRETYNPGPVTNANGLVTLEIGSGIPSDGIFSAIDWSSGTYFMKVETDPDGSTNYTIEGITQLVSVPYALFAKRAAEFTESDPTWNGAADQAGAIGRAGNVGIGISVPDALLHTYGTSTGGGNILFMGNFKATTPGDPPASGAGTRMMWYPDRAAFRAGFVSGSHWDKDSIGNFSFAYGVNAIARGNNSLSAGNGTNARGGMSVAMGNYTKAFGHYSTALGNTTTASGDNSTSLGGNTVASGANSTSLGLNTTASGLSSVAMGQNTVASGDFSLATGYSTQATGNYSTALGYATYAPALAATAIGAMTTASGTYSTATGGETTASGSFSTSMGRGSRATGDYSFAINLAPTQGPEVGANTFRISGATSIGGNVAWTNHSDGRLKKDIEQLENENNLDRIMQLNGVRFRWKENGSLLNLGFIAQEVLGIIPESVRYDPLNDIYSMEYTAIIPVLAEGIKQQQHEIEAVRDENRQLRSELEILKERLAAIEAFIKQ